MSSLAGELQYPQQTLQVAFPSLASSKAAYSPEAEIPFATPYVDRVRLLKRFNVNFAIYMEASGGKKEPELLSMFFVRWELLRSGIVVYRETLALQEASRELFLFGGGTEHLEHESSGDLTNPISLSSGQSFTWRFYCFYRPPREEPPKEAGLVQVSSASTWLGAPGPLSAEPSNFFYEEEDLRGALGIC